ncbi:hypothetical protein PO909_003211 [Leuciscus waleckii]
MSIQICPGNVSAPRKCPTGMFNPYTGKSSIQDCQCGPGEEPNFNQTECVDCAEGYYSTLCSAQCHLCPTGSHCPYKKMSAPLPCPVGHYSYMPGQTECKKCNGSSVYRSTVTPVWSRGQSHLGQRSRQLISCPPGTYRDGERSDCVVCPAGHYCVANIAIQCPAGTYGPKEGLQRERDCAICPAGFYCLEGTSRRPSSQFLCPQGYYCEEGTGVPHGSPCPAGTAGGQLGQTSRAACKRCAEGRYCPTGVKDCLKCPPGFYCPEGTSDPMPCQPGTFNPLEGQDALADCRPCYPGKSCTQVALKFPDVDCMPGYLI